jgi:hypothetical protein
MAAEPNMAKNDKLLPVSVRSVVRRIGRKLAENQKLKRAGTKSAEWLEEHGQFFIVDKAKGTIIERDTSLEALARRLGALENYERLDDD